MILETALSVLLSPEDMGFYIGPYSVKANNTDGMDARVFIIKLWLVMLQFTVFTPYKR